MSVDLRLEGYAEAVQLLKHLPEALQVKALNRVLIKASSPAVREARKNARSISKRLSQSIKAWQPKRSKAPVVFFGPKKQTMRDLDVRFSHLVEFGAQGVKGKSRDSKSARNDGKDLFRIMAGQARIGSRYRKDQAPHPYMFPAWQSKSAEVSRIMREETTDLLMKEIQKKAYKP